MICSYGSLLRCDSHEGVGGLIKRIIAFFAAIVGGYVFAVLTYSQLNLSNLTDMGVALTITERVATAGHDLLSMGGMYLPIMAVAMFVAFVLAALVIRRVPHLRTLVFVLAGAVGMFALIMFFKAFMGTNPIAVTRTIVGVVSQCLAGAIAGFIYAKVNTVSETQT